MSSHPWSPGYTGPAVAAEPKPAPSKAPWVPRKPSIPTGRKHVPFEVDLQREIATLELQIASVELMLRRARSRLWGKRRELQERRAKAR